MKKLLERPELPQLPYIYLARAFQELRSLYQSSPNPKLKRAVKIVQDANYRLVQRKKQPLDHPSVGLFLIVEEAIRYGRKQAKK